MTDTAHDPEAPDAARDDAAAGAPTRLGAARARLSPALAWLRRHQTLLWWTHSLYALAIGVGVMWLGARNYAWLRATYAYVAFIWIASFALPRLLRHPRVPPRWREPLRLAINYFVKNFYQQLLFFVLPVYWASTTLGARNTWFVVLVAVSAVLSTFDVVYDRHLSVKRTLGAVFFAFNLFACVNLVLPVLWSLSNVTAMRLAAVLATVALLTLALELRHLRRRPVLIAVAVSATLLFLLVEFARPLVPPAPLTIVHAQFGESIARTPPAIPSPLSSRPPGAAGRLYVLTAVSAPLGLRDRVRHVWSLDGRVISTSPFHDVTGGRREGYRLWTSATVPAAPAGGSLRVDVETEGGQLIGRAVLPVREAP